MTLPTIDNITCNIYSCINVSLQLSEMYTDDCVNCSLIYFTTELNDIKAIISGCGVDTSNMATNSTGGLSWQQDLGNVLSLPTTSDGGMFDVVYKDSNGWANRVSATRFPFLFDGSNIPQYYDNTGTLTYVNTDEFFITFICSVQDPRTGKGVISYTYPFSFIAQVDAQNITWYEAKVLFSDILGDEEIRPLYKLIYEYKSSYNSLVKYSVLKEYEDIRRINASF